MRIGCICMKIDRLSKHLITPFTTKVQITPPTSHSSVSKEPQRHRRRAKIQRVPLGGRTRRLRKNRGRLDPRIRNPPGLRRFAHKAQRQMPQLGTTNELHPQIGNPSFVDGPFRRERVRGLQGHPGWIAGSVVQRGRSADQDPVRGEPGQPGRPAEHFDALLRLRRGQIRGIFRGCAEGDFSRGCLGDFRGSVVEEHAPQGLPGERMTDEVQRHHRCVAHG